MSGVGGMCRAKTELRWMRFVDGENFVYQGSKFLAERFNRTAKLDIVSTFFKKDHFLWLPAQGWSAATNYYLAAQWASARKENNQTPEAIRAYYYTVVSGARDEIVPVTGRMIWNIGFNPRVIWKEKAKKKSKAVDSCTVRAQTVPPECQNKNFEYHLVRFIHKKTKSNTSKLSGLQNNMDHEH